MTLPECLFLMQAKAEEEARQDLAQLDIMVHAFGAVMNGGEAWSAMRDLRAGLERASNGEVAEPPREATQEEVHTALALAGVSISPI